MTAPDTAAIREAITEHWGPRCRTLDTEDFPELVAPGEGRCPACRAWEQLDALCDALDDAKAENERLQTIIDNLHAVEQKHRETANAEFHRANRLQVENERLTKELDEVRAQVAMLLEMAASMSVEGEVDIPQITKHLIRALTPADAQAALEAYGLEKVREGMQRAAEVARERWNDPPCEADAEYIPNAILADMEKLK